MKKFLVSLSIFFFLIGYAGSSGAVVLTFDDIPSVQQDTWGEIGTYGGFEFHAVDGHESLTSSTTAVLSPTDEPGHSDFIVTADNSPWDWRNSQNDNLWQGAAGTTNNPCPQGFRLPTEAELNTELESWTSDNADGAFASPLRLVVPGYRHHFDGNLAVSGLFGYYWSRTFYNEYSRHLRISTTTGTGMFVAVRADGYSVRCIKD